MAATTAESAFGTLLQYGDDPDSPSTWTTIAEVTSISGPGASLDFDDATHMESPDGFEEPIPTIGRFGSVSASCNHLKSDTTHNTLITKQKNKTRTSFRVLFPGGARAAQFAGYIESYNSDHSHDAKAGFDLSIRLTEYPDRVDVP